MYDPHECDLGSDAVARARNEILDAPGRPETIEELTKTWYLSNNTLDKNTADSDAFVHYKVCPKKGDNSVPLYRRVVKADYLNYLEDSNCWLIDKEERMRKAAAYFAQLRITDATAEETV